jgi:SAM-dependent methyltransferase
VVATVRTHIKPSDLLLVTKYELRSHAGRMVRRMLGRKVPSPLRSRVPPWKVKRLILKHGFAVADGGLSWFYTAPDRGDADPLTNYSLRYITEKHSKDAQILVTGCGTGITVFYLADTGFQHVTGVDLLPECIEIANEVKALGGYTGTEFFVGDGFHPSLTGTYDVITALHWVFSAWMGNYGNEPADTGRTKDPVFRERLLTDLLAQYVPHLRSDGEFLIELTDAVTDYRLPEDHVLGDVSSTIYPVRHAPEQVERCAAEVGLTVLDKKLCVSFGHHPSTLYILRRT